MLTSSFFIWFKEPFRINVSASWVTRAFLQLHLASRFHSTKQNGCSSWAECGMHGQWNLGIKFFFAHTKTTTLHWLKCQILNICLCSSILETIFPWHTQFAQYTWIAKGQNCAYWHKLSVTLTSDTRHGSHYKCARETTLSKKILLKST